MADAPREGWSEQNDEIARAAGFESWAAWCDSEEQHLGRKICGARTRDEDPCRRPAGAPSGNGKDTGHKGEGRCGDHGGLALAGEEAPWYKGKGLSRYLDHRGEPAQRQLRAAAEHVAQWRDLWPELDLMRARVKMLVGSIADEQASPAALRRAIARVRAALRGGDVDRLKASFTELEAALEPAETTLAAWDESSALTEQIRKLLETQVKIEQQAFAPMNEMREFYLLEKLKEIILTHVPEGSRTLAVKQLAQLRVQFAPTDQPN